VADAMQKNLDRWFAAGIPDQTTGGVAAARSRNLGRSGDRLRWPVLLALALGGFLLCAGILLLVAATFPLEEELERFRSRPHTALFFGFSVHFADLHILVNRERWIADGRTSGGWSVTCRDTEVATRTLEGISIAVPLRTRHGQGV